LENTFHLVPEFIVLELRLRPKPINLSQIRLGCLQKQHITHKKCEKKRMEF